MTPTSKQMKRAIVALGVRVGELDLARARQQEAERREHDMHRLYRRWMDKADHLQGEVDRLKGVVEQQARTIEHMRAGRTAAQDRVAFLENKLSVLSDSDEAPQVSENELIAHLRKMEADDESRFHATRYFHPAGEEEDHDPA